MLICSVSQALLDYLVRGFAYCESGRRCQGNSHVIGCFRVYMQVSGDGMVIR